MRRTIYRLLLLSFSLIFFSISFPVSAQQTWHVPGDFPTISAAISNATVVSGDTIIIAPGTYTELISVTKSLTIQGAGANTIIQAPTTGSGNVVSITAAGSGATLSNLQIRNGSRGINLASGANNITIENVISTGNYSAGINIANSDGVTILNSSFINNLNANVPPTGGNGLRMGTGDRVDNLLIEDSHFDGNYQGVYVAANNPLTSFFQNVTIRRTTFNDNHIKGIYLEKASSVLFEEIEVNNSGNHGTYNHNAGIDFNLLYGVFSDITIRNSTITNSGHGNVAVIFKARQNYNGVSSSLQDIAIENTQIINNPGTGIVFGGEGETIPNTSIDSSYIYGNNAGLTSYIPAITATDNWWGCNDPSDPNAGCDPITGSGIDTSSPMTLSHAISLPITDAQCTLTLSFEDSTGNPVNVYNGETVTFNSTYGSIDPSAVFTGHSLTAAFDTTYPGYPINITATVDGHPVLYENVVCGIPVTDPVYASVPNIGGTAYMNDVQPTQSIIIENAVYGPNLELSSITVDNPAFTVDATSASIAPLDNFTLGITCSGLQTGTLSIAHNDPAQASPATYQLSCDMSDSAPVYSSNPAIGAVIDLNNQTTPSVNFEVTNLANRQALVISDIAVDSPLDFSYNSTGFTLGNYGDSESFDVSCDASAVGTYSTMLSITHNDPNIANPATYTINCEVSDSTMPTPQPPALTIVDIVDAGGNVLEDMVYVEAVSGISVRFNIPVLIDGTGNPDSALNPDNYILLQGPNYTTTSCIAGVDPSETQISPVAIEYNTTNNTVYLSFDPALGLGAYRLILCGTTSIVSANDPSIHLNNGTDLVINFTVAGNAPAPQPTAVPTVAAPESLGVTELPATGETPLWAELLGRWFGR